MEKCLWGVLAKKHLTAFVGVGVSPQTEDDEFTLVDLMAPCKHPCHIPKVPAENMTTAVVLSWGVHLAQCKRSAIILGVWPYERPILCDTPPLVVPHPLSFPGGGGSLGQPKIFRCGSLCCCVGDCVVGHCHLYPLHSWQDILLTFAEMEFDSTTTPLGQV